MTLEELQSENERLKEELAQLREKQGSEPPDESKIEALAFSAVNAAVQKAFAGFTIQSANDITISGTGLNITIGRNPTPDTP